MNRKLARISYNSKGWRCPTGEAAGLEKETFNQKMGFGYEDWLLRSEWEIDGWRYAFLQGANKSRKKLVKEKLPFDVVLFCKRPDGKRQYVGEITEVECLDEWQAGEALDVFKANGWFAQMKAEVGAAGGETVALDGSSYAVDILNVRFRQSNVTLYPADTFARDDAPIRFLNRYLLVDLPVDAEEQARKMRTAAGSLKIIPPYLRSPIRSILVTPEHRRMQNILKEELERECPENSVIFEENFVDVKMESLSERWIYEIKTDLNPILVLRLAIGQLLEYAHFNVPSDGRALHLIAVGRRALNSSERQYLERLKDCIQLDVDYRWVEI